MPLVKSTTLKRINKLSVFPVILTVLVFSAAVPVYAQDNSPYSRYGLGDIVPQTNISSRAMGGLAAAYNDPFSINYANPATYGSFQALKEQTTNKLSYGRAILDVGINMERRTLSEPDNINRFTASNALFSHVQVGLPLKKNWGISFGLRPLTRISYNIFDRSLLYDGNTGNPIDSAITLYSGTGGAFLGSLGTGLKFDLDTKSSLSVGITGGYMFGKKDYSTRISFFNDTVSYAGGGNYQTVTSIGDLFFQGGLQYQSRVKDDLFLTIGAYGNWKQDIKTSDDIIRETYQYSESNGNTRIDSVSEKIDKKGSIVYPATYTAGFVLERPVTSQKSGWLVGVDYANQAWTKFRLNGAADPSLADKWELRIGGQLRPVPKKSYFSNVAYRAGFFIGPDYIKAPGELKQYGISVGMGLPIANYNLLSPGAINMINLSFEFIKRGNDNNLLKDNLFRFSAGFAFSDLWFRKRKYD